MERYEIFYRQFLLGILTVDSATGNYHYIPDAAGTAAVLALTSLPVEMRTETSGPPIPFLQNRIMNMKRCGLTEINYQTDYFLVRACP